MKTKRSMTMPIVLILLFCIAMVGGVYATWSYTSSGALPCADPMSINMKEYAYSEIPASGEGEKHQEVVNNITDDNTGFNNPDSTLNTLIKEKQQEGRDSFSSFDTQGGDYVREELGIAPNVEFIVQFPTDDVRYVYTSTMERGQSGSFWTGGSSPNVPVGEYIYIIYRTEYRLDPTTQKWKTIETLGGYAKSADYANTSWSGIWDEYSPAFDPNSWTAGKIGTGTNDAIYAYNGMASCAVIGNATDTIYYKIEPSRRNLKIYIDGSMTGVNVTLYNRNGKALGLNRAIAQDGSIEFSARVTRNNLYYISFQGAEEINFTIQ